MGGVSKAGVLAAFQPHIFFDDQEGHCRAASEVVSTAKVPIPLLVPDPPSAASAPENGIA
jgi:5'-nucleotidase